MRALGNASILRARLCSTRVDSNATWSVKSRGADTSSACQRTWNGSMVNDAGDVATTSPQNPPTRMRTMSVRLPGEAKTRLNDARTCPSSATNVAARK